MKRLCSVLGLMLALTVPAAAQPAPAPPSAVPPSGGVVPSSVSGRTAVSPLRSDIADLLPPVPSPDGVARVSRAFTVPVLPGEGETFAALLEQVWPLLRDGDQLNYDVNSGYLLLTAHGPTLDQVTALISGYVVRSSTTITVRARVLDLHAPRSAGGSLARMLGGGAPESDAGGAVVDGIDPSETERLIGALSVFGPVDVLADTAVVTLNGRKAALHTEDRRCEGGAPAGNDGLTGPACALDGTVDLEVAVRLLDGDRVMFEIKGVFGSVARRAKTVQTAVLAPGQALALELPTPSEPDLRRVLVVSTVVSR